MIEAFCLHPLCEEASWQHWLARRQADEALRHARNPGIELYKACERTQIAYWRRFLEVRAQLMPDLAPALEADLRGKLKFWYELMQHERVWVAAGRPREL